MHELSIATSIVEQIRSELAKRPGSRATALGLRIGALAGVDAESLRFGFDAIVSDSDLAPMRLEIELVPRQHKCIDCNTDYSAIDNDSRCPSCGSFVAICIAGEELDIAWLEVEEEACPAS